MAIQFCVADAAADATPMARACADQRRRRSVRPDCARFPALDDLDEFRDLAEVVHLEVGENRRQRNAGLVTDELGVVFGLVLVRRRTAEDCLLEGELDVGGRSQQGDDRRLPALLSSSEKIAKLPSSPMAPQLIEKSPLRILPALQLRQEPEPTSRISSRPSASV